MDRGAWQATVHGIIESDMTEYTHTHTHIYHSALKILYTASDLLNSKECSEPLANGNHKTFWEKRAWCIIVR